MKDANKYTHLISTALYYSHVLYHSLYFMTIFYLVTIFVVLLIGAEAADKAISGTRHLPDQGAIASRES
jgi:hypothetical protein